MLAFAGCNSLAGLDPGTLADPIPPSCAAGWGRRIPIDITNATTSTLAGYQVVVPAELRALPQLRFGMNGRSLPLAFEMDSQVWVSVDLAPGTTRIHAYYDNPNADAWTSPPVFETDLIANASFESTGGWTISGDARYESSSAWASDGERSLLIDAYRHDRVFRALDFGITQRVRFPPGSDYVLRFDLAVVAASNSGLNSNGEFFVGVGDGLLEAWRKSGDEGNITGEYRDVETIPFGPGDVGIMFGVTLTDGTTPSYAKGFYDHIRVRKHVTPEPVVTAGADEDACAP